MSCSSSIARFAGRPVVVFGSRSLSPHVLDRVRSCGSWLASLGCPVVSGGAVGADLAASSGAASAGGRVLWFLPEDVSQLPRPCRALARSSRVSCVPFAGGTEGSPVSRLFSRSYAALRWALEREGACVVFIRRPAWDARRGGSFGSVRMALRLGFVPGVSLFVFGCSGSSVSLLSAGAVSAAV